MTNTATNPRELTVYLNDTEVGSLTLLPDDRTLFTFSTSYVENSARPTLSLWFKTPLGELKTEEKIRRQAHLPPFFSNLLPEGHLRQYLSKKLKVKPEREFSLLSALGEDLPGAVRVESAGTHLEHAPRHDNLIEDSSKNILRFSLAGIQLKFSALQEATGGLTIPANGIGGSWIVKLPSNTFPRIPEAEFSMLQLAERVGINVPECKIIPTNSISNLPEDITENFGNSLAVKRFDRNDDGTRIHMEDFAQIFGLYPSEKYENASFDRIAFVLLSEAGEEDYIQFIRRLVFIIAIGNGDMHLKNWSLLYTDPIRPRLSPAYDLVPSKVYVPNDDLGLGLGGAKTFTDVTERQFSTLAGRAKASEALTLKVVRESVDNIQSAWNETRSALPLDDPTRSAIDSHMKSLNLFSPKKKF